jgi:hypothetical protein
LESFKSVDIGKQKVCTHPSRRSWWFSKGLSARNCAGRYLKEEYHLLPQWLNMWGLPPMATT